MKENDTLKPATSKINWLIFEQFESGRYPPTVRASSAFQPPPCRRICQLRSAGGWLPSERQRSSRGWSATARPRALTSTVRGLTGRTVWEEWRGMFHRGDCNCFIEGCLTKDWLLLRGMLELIIEDKTWYRNKVQVCFVLCSVLRRCVLWCTLFFTSH